MGRPAPGATVIGSRLICTSLVVVGFLASFAEAGVFNRKPRVDASKAKQLVETLRTDPDEAKRLAAAAELGQYDPKGDAAVLSALIAALQRDPAASVRAQVTHVLGDIKPYSHLAGVALERAADGDASLGVRQGARESLWEYHLNGYQSQKISEMVAFQTPEPPLARFGQVRSTAGNSQPSVIFSTLPGTVEVSAVPVSRTPFVPPVRLPSLVAPPGLVGTGNARRSEGLLLRPDYPLNRTDEPPLARKRRSPFFGS